MVEKEVIILTGIIILVLMLIVGYIIKNKKERKIGMKDRNENYISEENPITGGSKNPIFGRKLGNPILNKLNGKIVDENKLK